MKQVSLLFVFKVIDQDNKEAAAWKIISFSIFLADQRKVILRLFYILASMVACAGAAILFIELKHGLD